ncbi:hypothetical protein KSD_97080 [Ktedonobacter sp. SOSP1-85]|uniref:hypothetical protein n=1 Tax=Ktedonobacter sp. SOSP1-85 TaxID=2778367 RepID=UPI001915E065|nr:hypothetical protein [Ktedonobacter sp. SOSP1-85]GHO81937.1 hypothetical protein KSD_97080 [Ktedonobacter sp. SOSP1-85]
MSQWGTYLFGINWAYGEIAIVVHSIWSAAIPILLTELLFPAQRTIPYLRRPGLITGIWYVLGIALIGLCARTTYPYSTHLARWQ